jgi:hypothetical protein
LPPAIFASGKLLPAHFLAGIYLLAKTMPSKRKIKKNNEKSKKRGKKDSRDWKEGNKERKAGKFIEKIVPLAFFLLYVIVSI